MKEEEIDLRNATGSMRDAIDVKCKFFKQAETLVNTLIRMYAIQLDHGEVSERRKFHSFLREKYFEIIAPKFQSVAEYMVRGRFIAYKEYDKDFDMQVEREKEILRNEYRYVFGEGVFPGGKGGHEEFAKEIQKEEKAQ